MLIVTADHGEAFHEHGVTGHATMLYEEQVRVPLLVRVPGVEAKKVQTPVSLMDVGPTVLDLFRRPTPGSNMGESLLGTILDHDVDLTRPIVAEGRLKKSWVFPDGYKLIVDDFTGAKELFDLNLDPGERHNIYDHDVSAGERLATLRHFFHVHRQMRPGYRVPLRR